MHATSHMLLRDEVRLACNSSGLVMTRSMCSFMSSVALYLAYVPAVFASVTECVHINAECCCSELLRVVGDYASSCRIRTQEPLHL